MEACIFCGNPNNLVEAVGEKEIIFVCQSCAVNRGMPIIRRPSVDQIKDIYKTPRLKLKEEPVKKAKDPETLKLEEELKGIVKKNVSKDYGNLIDNFHWHVQQGRRHKKLSPKQLSEAIAEPEVLIEMIEKGQLPENYDKVITKLEQFFRIKLRKADSLRDEASLDIKKLDPNNVSIGDLKAMKEKSISQEKDQKTEEVSKDNKTEDFDSKIQ
ncbi:hypothetical protein J4477_02765 [Candidatus Pacearchaeota archaeon]|nr:hypothetical protein [Candidatus Pacearchaeota archaeon]